ncbi:MAG: WD40 domain-containing protein [Candidatus Hodarchaeales archaeon]|jgi:WD40 repeat protein/tetratricopeptide (TPR) repeat protein
MIKLNRQYLFIWLVLLVLMLFFITIPLQGTKKSEKILINTYSIYGLNPWNHQGKKGKITGINHPNPLFAEAMYEMTKHVGWVRTVAFSPDGKILTSGGDDSIIRLWNVEDGTLNSTLSGHSGDIESLIYSPDGSILVSGDLDGMIKVWDVVSGDNYTHSGLSPIMCLAISPDGKTLVSGTVNGLIEIWNTTNWKKQYFEAHGEAVRAVDFSADGKLMVSCSDDQTIKIWNAIDWNSNPVLPFENQGDYVMDVEFSPVTSQLLASTVIDNEFLIRDLESGSKQELIGHGSGVGVNPRTKVAFSPDEQLLATGGGDGLIKLWDVTSGKLIQTLTGYTSSLMEVVFSPDGTLLASCSQDSTVKIWNVARGTDFQELTEQTSAISAVAFSPDGTIIASSTDDQEVALWNVTSDINGIKITESQPLNGHVDEVTSIAFSPSGTVMASGGSDTDIILWNTTTWGQMHVLSNHTEKLLTVAFSSDDTVLASASDHTVRLWNVSSGIEIRTRLFGHSSDVRSVAFSPTGTILASSSADRDIRLWYLSNWSLKGAPLKGHDSGVNCIAFSPNGQILASGSDDKTIRLWSPENGKQISQIPLKRHDEPVLSMDFLDNTVLASVSADGTVRLWNVSSEENFKTFYLHKIGVMDVSFSPGGMIATGGTDGIVRIWDIQSKPDYDNDGMLDGWELDFSFDPSNFHDKFDDGDGDGLMNSLEHFLGTFPNNTDSDNDSIPDGWEHLLGLKPLSDDAKADLDEDGIDNLYEYENGLNVRLNDAYTDLDGDGLSNIDEFHLGTKANDLDTDGDGFSDKIEIDFNTDPLSTSSSPINYLILAVIFLVCLIIIITAVIFRKRRLKLIMIYGTPDFDTALKVQASGYPDHSTYLQAGSDAKTLVAEGIASYFQGNTVKAIQQYEQALTMFERLGDRLSTAATIFRVAQIQMERQELTVDSAILKLFPRPPRDEPVIKSIDHMLQAVLAEAKKNWGMATEYWKDALGYSDLDIEFQLICRGAILEFEVRDWLDNPVTTTREPLITRLNEWQEACKINQQFGNLCHAYLLRARIAFASIHFDEVEKWLNQCLKSASEEGLLIYQDAARKETEILLRHRKKIQEELDKLLRPEEHEKVLQEYIKEALDSLDKEGLL